MSRIAFVAAFTCLTLAAALPAQAARIYRVDLTVEEKGEPPSTPLILVESGKPGSIQVDRADGSGRRYEVRVDAGQDERGRTTGTVDLRVVDITKRGRAKERGRGVVKIERQGDAYDWQPRRRVRGLAIKVRMWLQPM